MVAQTKDDAKRWTDFVAEHQRCSSYHRWEWKQVIEKSFGCRAYYLMAEEGGRVRGILPLALQRSWMFGKWMSSVPLVQGGGVSAETEEAAHALLTSAIELTRQTRSRYLELRGGDRNGANLSIRAAKVSALIPLERNPETLWNRLDSRVRTSVRKGMKSGLSAVFGKEELLGDFYQVFAENMRDLGTPVYRKSLFAEICRAFPDDTRICVVRHEDKIVAAAFLIGFRDTLESAWAASLRECLQLKPNMFLHWNVLHFACQQGYRTFDFGRSTIGSSAHQYKMQWGSKEVPLGWMYWLPDNGTMPEINRHNQQYQFAIRCWQKLPVSIANAVGPRLVKHLPS